MSPIRILAASAAAIVTMAGASFAGGFVAPVVQPPVIVAPQAPIVTDWAGAYVGGSLGYSFGADDEIGLGTASNLGSVDVKGVTAGLHTGYRWQRGNWVYGPELGIEGGSVDATENFLFAGADRELESSVNYIVSLQLKTGYIVNPQTLVYGTVGAVYGDFDYRLDDATESYDNTGYSLGLGVERKLNERTAVFAEWQYRNFGKTDVTFAGETTRATPEHHNVKVGVNFSF